MKNSKVQTHYGDKIVEYELPEGWHSLGNLQTENLPCIGEREMKRALENPFDKPRLEDLARGKKNAVIIASDITRPVQGEIALPLILNSLNRAGMTDQHMVLIMGGGSHRPPEDFQKACVEKYGKQVVSRVRLLYHNPDENLISFGRTARGHLVEINKWVAEADLKIGFGGIIPHGFGGYSGGAKSILPGVASRETMIQNHLMVTDSGVGMGSVEGNPIRAEMEEVADKVGLDFIFNLVLNAKGEPVGAVSGDFRQAYRKGVALARRIFQATLPRQAQVIFSSGYPYDIHLYQSLNGPCSVLNACQDGGTIIHLTPAYKGILEGTRSLFSRVKSIGYKELFSRLEHGEREDESVRGFFYPEINIGLGMILFRAMVDRGIRIVVVTENIPREDLEEMGFEYGKSIGEAVSQVHLRVPRADVAAALNAKVIVSIA